MTTKERIASAQSSDNLRERPAEYIGDIDIIRACGLVGATHSLGLSIWRWRYSGARREVISIAENFISKGYPEAVVLRVLHYLDHSICPSCHGRGYKQLDGVPVLSDVVCPDCHGTGRVPIEGDAERELIERIERMEREVAALIMKKLNADMDF